MVFGAQSFRSHENVAFFHDQSSGLEAIIAIHSTALGPAFGGCRIWPYATEEQALEDVLRLSRGMSFKNALAGLPFGGGKSVIIADAKAGKTEELLDAFGRAVGSLGGRYITAEDVGITEADIEIFARHTRHVVVDASSAVRGAGGIPRPRLRSVSTLPCVLQSNSSSTAATSRDLSVAIQGSARSATTSANSCTARVHRWWWRTSIRITFGAPPLNLARACLPLKASCLRASTSSHPVRSAPCSLPRVLSGSMPHS